MNDQEFRTKLIYELHEINLSLRELSGRNIKTEKDMTERRETYSEKYFRRTVPKTD